MKVMAAENMEEGVDTVKFNAYVDKFEDRIMADTLSVEKIGLFIQSIQDIGADKKIDKDEVELLYSEMNKLYPGMIPEDMSEDMPAESDSTMMEEESVE